MTAEMVAKLGKVDYRGERPCLPQDGMVQLVLAIDAPRRRLVKRIVNLLRKRTK